MIQIPASQAAHEATTKDTGQRKGKDQINICIIVSGNIH